MEDEELENNPDINPHYYAYTTMYKWILTKLSLQGFMGFSKCIVHHDTFINLSNDIVDSRSTKGRPDLETNNIDVMATVSKEVIIRRN